MTSSIVFPFSLRLAVEGITTYAGVAAQVCLAHGLL